MKITVALKDVNGEAVQSFEGESPLHIALERTYLPGDRLEVSGPEHLLIQMDQCLDRGEIYVPDGHFVWTIPFGSERSAYPPHAFEGERHVLKLQEMTEEEIRAQRVLSANPHDLRGETDFFPHATATVETRGEADFAARNVIDGTYANHSHGGWPYGSWGIGTDQDAALTVHFGREILAGRIRILLRADFPHDSWWESCELVFSDGSREKMVLKKSDQFQEIKASKKISWVRIEQLKKADDPSPFPSLRQLEVIGCDLP